MLGSVIHVDTQVKGAVPVSSERLLILESISTANQTATLPRVLLEHYPDWLDRCEVVCLFVSHLQSQDCERTTELFLSSQVEGREGEISLSVTKS